MSFEKLNKEAFNDDPIKEFRRIAGGLPTYKTPYSGINSNAKRALMWNFFRSDRATEAMLDAKTVYSGKGRGATIRELLNEMDDGDQETIHSIEHVIPKTKYLKKPLEERGMDKLEVNGATVNPLNFLPCHSSINSKRRQRLFDFDGDAVSSDSLAIVDGSSREFEGGEDQEGEWVPPLVSRGDIARCVLYMALMYELEIGDGEDNFVIVNEDDVRVLRQWMIQDAPSKFEKEYGMWLRETKPLGIDVQNPFVSNPELATNNSMFEKLIKSVVTPPPPRPAPVVIDSILPNPSGFDTAGKERLTLRNTTTTTINLIRWSLEIVVENISPKKYFFTTNLSGGQRVDFSFPDNDVLINSRDTTIILRDPDDNVVSVFNYAASDPRSGKVLMMSRL